MKKSSKILTLLFMCAFLAFGLAACNGLNTNGCVGCGSNSSKIDETVSDDLESFDYTKTGNSLTINDIKDKTVKKIILPEETTTIGKGAFKDCTNLITILIGDNVADIEDGAFQNCDNLDAVYYKGTEETWNGIAVGENNEDFTSAHTYYYSEVYPENFAEDTYWHYDGHNAVIWEENTEPPISHTHNYVNGVCSVCGEVDSNYVEPPHTHNYINGVCSVCGEIDPNYVEPPHTHVYADTVIENRTKSTCTIGGSYDNVVYCSVCGIELSRTTITLNPTGHTPVSAVQENDVAPDCVNSGIYDSVVYCSTCGEELSRETIVIPSTGVHNYVNGVCSVCGAEEYDYIYFGVYPQSDVTATKGGELSTYVQTLPSNGNNNGWTGYNYYISSSNTTDFMWYKDVDVDNNGTKDYRAVYFTSYRPWCTDYSSSMDFSHQYDNGYYTSNVYWFKFEPIKWRILSEKGNTAIILAELILDSQDYNYTYYSRNINNKTVHPNNYEYSSIRAWLNDNFYNTAFNEYEKALINTIEVDNSARSTNPDNNATCWNSGVNNYACENTYDKVWLLSEQEVTTASYGFNTSDLNNDVLRQKKTSAYAQCQGAYTNNKGDDYDGSGWWWLRSPHYNIGACPYLVAFGMSSQSASVEYTSSGVVPALQISLPADEIVGTYEVYSWTINETTIYAGQEYNGHSFNAEDLTFNVDIDGTCRFVHMGVLAYEGTWEKIANGEYSCIVRHVDADDWFITDNFTLEHGKITFGEFFADYVFIKKN